MEPSKHGLKPLDVAECLMSEAAIVEFLRISMEKDTPEEFFKSLSVAARARARLAADSASTPSVPDWFRSVGLSLAPIATQAPGA